MTYERIDAGHFPSEQTFRKTPCHQGFVFGSQRRGNFWIPGAQRKTTTIKMVMGFLFPDSGDIYINGINTKNDYEGAMASIGGIVENPEMYKNLSGRTNLEMYARLHGTLDDKHIDELVEMVGMKARIQDKVRTYSLGMKQRVGVAQALVHNPRVLILDEPTNGLDPSGIKELRDILSYLAHEKGVSVMVSSHQLAEMALMCDRVGIISNGVLLSVEPIQELLERTQSENIVDIKTDGNKAKEILGETWAEKVRSANEKEIRIAAGKGDIPVLIQALGAGGAEIYGISEEKLTLEEAYLRLTEGGGGIA